MLSLPQAQRLQGLVSWQLPRGRGGVQDRPGTAGDAPLAPELLPTLCQLRVGHTLVLQILASNLTGGKLQCHLFKMQTLRLEGLKRAHSTLQVAEQESDGG